MSHARQIKDALERMIGLFGRRPLAAMGSGVMSARIVDGLRCEAREGDWQFVIDMPRDAGGSATGPAPGVHGRAALASCLAIGYRMGFALAGIEPRSLEVVVEADFDSRGLLGMADVYPGYLAVRHTLYVECDAPREAVLAVVDQAQRSSPYLHVFADPQPVTGQVVIGGRPKG